MKFIVGTKLDEELLSPEKISYEYNVDQLNYLERIDPTSEKSNKSDKISSIKSLTLSEDNTISLSSEIDDYKLSHDVTFSSDDANQPSDDVKSIESDNNNS